MALRKPYAKKSWAPKLDRAARSAAAEIPDVVCNRAAVEADEIRLTYDIKVVNEPI